MSKIKSDESILLEFLVAAYGTEFVRMNFYVEVIQCSIHKDHPEGCKFHDSSPGSTHNISSVNRDGIALTMVVQSPKGSKFVQVLPGEVKLINRHNVEL